MDKCVCNLQLLYWRVMLAKYEAGSNYAKTEWWRVQGYIMKVINLLEQRIGLLMLNKIVAIANLNNVNNVNGFE